MSSKNQHLRQVALVCALAAALACGRGDRAPTAPTTLSTIVPRAVASETIDTVFESFEIRPRELRGGDWTTATVVLRSAASVGGLVVTTTASKREARIPTTFTITEGARTASIRFSTGDVSADMEVLVTVTAGGFSRSVQMRLLPPGRGATPPPPASGGGSGTGTVSLRGLIN